MPELPEWTILVYMAGDNDLQDQGYGDLDEMMQVGSTTLVNVVVQLDTRDKGATRYYVKKQDMMEVQKMASLNTGDPSVLTDFVSWGTMKYPAKHYMLVLWNHGNGWEDWELPEKTRGSNTLRSGKIKHVNRALFRTTIKKIKKLPGDYRAIAIDEGSQDFLDNQELRSALESALGDGIKIDIVGCDACLMNMLEICYELKDVIRILVGSEETEPGTGWPYHFILKELVRNPSMTPFELSRTIVKQYGRWYAENGSSAEYITQSALDAENMQPIVDALDDLARLLLRSFRKVEADVALAKDRAQKFDTPRYLDLGDFAALLGKFSRNKRVAAAAIRVLKLVTDAKNGHFVIANTSKGQRVSRATGVSIYFPNGTEYAKEYTDLRLSRDIKWEDFLKKYFRGGG